MVHIVSNIQRNTLVVLIRNQIPRLRPTSASFREHFSCSLKNLNEYVDLAQRDVGTIVRAVGDLRLVACPVPPDRKLIVAQASSGTGWPSMVTAPLK